MRKGYASYNYNNNKRKAAHESDSINFLFPLAFGELPVLDAITGVTVVTLGLLSLIPKSLTAVENPVLAS